MTLSIYLSLPLSPSLQLLQSALGHHNLSSFEEALAFLDAALNQPAEKEIKSSASSQSLQALDKEPLIDPTFELEVCVFLNRGNIYRSCDEDEQAMLCYMEGWHRSQQQENKEWESIFINSIGVLAYYNIRYDIALLCFDSVVRFRETEYGVESSDTATALNNEGCSLFCMQERGEARLRFERSWLVGECKNPIPNLNLCLI
jgi:tetratricopeptide (TPR) repeat protein